MRTGFANHVIVSDRPHSGQAFLAAMPVGNEICVRVQSGFGASAVAWFDKDQAREISDLFADLVEEDTFGWAPGG